MLNTSLRLCPYEHWEKAAMSACIPSENFHCLHDEYDRIGWLCTEPIWIEKGRCPVYNSGAKKLDSISCNTDNCPSGNYRSNYAYIKNGCRLNTKKTEQKNTVNNTVSTDTDVNKAMHMEYFAVIGVAILVLLAAVTLVFFLRRRRHFHREVPTLEHDEGDDIILSLLKDTSKDTYCRAESFLSLKRYVVLRGVQGSGKTYLSKNLADNINQISKTECQVHWIHDVLDIEIPKLTSKALLVLDDIFYELQSNEEIQASIKTVEELFKKVCLSKSMYIIVTIPTYAWKEHADHFQNKTCFSNYVDLDTLSIEEKTEIFNHHLSRSVVKEEGSTRETKLILRESVKSAIIDYERCHFIGYPSCVAWICKMQDQFDLSKAAKFMDVPITRIKSEIYRLRDSKNFKERKMFLLLAFMAFCDGKLKVKGLDEDLLMSIARIVFPKDDCKQFLLQENDEGLYLLQEKYIRKISVGVYEFYLGVVRKIVFIIALERNLKALKENVKQEMWKRVAVQRGKVPPDLVVGELSHMIIILE